MRTVATTHVEALLALTEDTGLGHLKKLSKRRRAMEKKRQNL